VHRDRASGRRAVASNTSENVTSPQQTTSDWSRAPAGLPLVSTNSSSGSSSASPDPGPDHCRASVLVIDVPDQAGFVMREDRHGGGGG
jgi:hypothetical protein